MDDTYLVFALNRGSDVLNNYDIQSTVSLINEVFNSTSTIIIQYIK